MGDGDADCVGTEPGGDVRFAGYTILLKGPDVSQMSLRTGNAEVLCQGMPWSDSGVFWSEDGRQAMYLSNRHGPGLALVLLDVPTCTVRVVAGYTLFEDPLGWDPGEDRYRDP